MPLRSWLERNKIFFEILSAILISGTALIVSIAAYNVNRQQLLATEVAALPHFTVQTRLLRDAATGKFDHDELVVSNVGSPISNPHIRVDTFVRVRVGVPPVEEVFVPIVHYYFAQISSGAPTGELSTFKLAGNNAKFGRLYDEALAETRTKGQLIEVRIARIVTIHYIDRLNRASTEYFFDTSRVSEESVRDLLQSSSGIPMEDLDKLTLSKLIARIQDDKRLARRSAVLAESKLSPFR